LRGFESHGLTWRIRHSFVTFFCYQLLCRAQSTDDPAELGAIRKELVSILTVSVNDLDEDRISEESFQSMRAIWQIAMDGVREKSALVEADAHRQRVAQVN
jgi:hypothetical protein